MFETLLRTELLMFFLACTRSAGVVIVAPMPWTHAPARFKAVLVLMFGLLAYGSTGALGATALGDGQLLLATGSELLLGVAMGFVVRLAISVAEIAAEVVAPIWGLGVAQIFDPMTSSNQNALSALLRNLAVLLAVLAGVHRELIAALLSSFAVFPIGAAVSPGLALEPLLAMTAGALLTGVRFALPLIAVLFMTQIALAFVARAAPSMQVFNVGFTVTLMVGGAVLILVLPDIAQGLSSELSRVLTRIEAVLMSLQRGS